MTGSTLNQALICAKSADSIACQICFFVYFRSWPPKTCAEKPVFHVQTYTHICAHSIEESATVRDSMQTTDYSLCGYKKA